MITTRTRILSFLATVAMLVSMFACFVIPASAGKATMTDAEKVVAWQQVILSLDLATTTAMKNEIPKSYWAWWSASKNKVAAAPNNWWVGEGEEDRVATAADIEAAVLEEIAPNVGFPGDETKTLHWKAFSWDGDKYPRFVYHEFYELANYGAGADGKTHWSITAEADWKEMDKVARSESNAKYINADGEYFSNNIFHLTNNIDFDRSKKIMPLGARTGRKFAGTINGHGFGFNDIYIQTVSGNSGEGAAASNAGDYGDDYGYYSVYDNVTTKTGYYTLVGTGLIAILGNCTFENFGINSGAIVGGTGSATAGTSNFGAIYAGDKPTFKRVWSSATVISASNGYVSGLYTHAEKAETYNNTATVDGVVLDGHFVKRATSTDNGKYPSVATVVGGYSFGLATGTTFSNIIASANAVFYSSYDATEDASYVVSTAFIPTAKNVYMFGQSTEGSATFRNVYGITGTNKVKAGYTTGKGGDITASEEAASTALLWNGKAEAAAFDSNTKQGDATDPVYFTLVGDKIRPNGTAANKIVKLTVKAVIDGVAGEPVTLYKNKDTALTADLLSGWAGIETTATSYIVNGNAQATCPAALEADETTIELVVSALGALNEAWAPYKDMEAKYLAAGADSAWTTASNAVAAAATGEGTITAAEEAVAAFETALAENGTYATYEQEDDGKEIPGYALAGTYGAYNKDNVWAITSPDDWEAMDVVATSAAKNAAYFVGAKFHLYDDVNFADEPMAPLGYENELHSYFAGTLDGHGYGFSNVNISGALAAASVGLFKTIGNCVIRDFGINSGTITNTVDGAAASVSTFGTNWYSADDTTTLTRVWSGATLNAAANLVVSALVGTYNHTTADIFVDGFTFYGAMESVEGTVTMVYGVYGSNRNAASQTSTYENIITAPKSLPANIDNAIFGYNSPEAVANVKGNGNLSNVYGIGFTNAFRTIANGDTAGAQHKGSTYDLTKPAGRVFAADADLQSKTSAGAAAYELNGKNIGYYFTFAADGGIRPTGTEANRVVKYAITLNGEDQEPVYANAGAAVDITKVVTDDISEAEVVVSDANGTLTPDGDGKYAITGDVTIALTMAADNVEINELKAALADKIAEVEAFIADKVNLDMKYFKAGAISAEDWLAKAKSETLEDLRAAKAHLDNGDLVIAMKDDYPNFPAYKDHAKYEAYQPENANWLIVDPADWYEMNKVMNEGANGAYFANTTFHLVGDVDFGHISEWDADVACPEVEEGAAKIPGYTLNEDYMLPLGSYGTKTFSGTIDGHSYGFENVYVSTFVTTSQDQKDYGYIEENTPYDHTYAGLISKIQQATFKNFGINSGVIDSKGGDNKASASTFGAIYLSGTTFKNVWSGATIKAISNSNPSGLAGLYNNKTYAIDVDGFTFYGELSKAANARTMVYGITGANTGAIDGSTIKNVILYPTFDVDDKNVPASADGKKYASALFGFSSPDAYDAATISNVYGIGFDKAYRATIVDLKYPNDEKPELDGRVFGDDANILITGKKAKEIAREMNAIGAETGVYYKLDANGNLRPTSEANTLVKATINFIEVGSEEIGNTRIEYFNNSGTFGLRDAYSLKFMFGDEDVVVEGDGSYVGGVLTVNGDVTVTVNYTQCDHKDDEGNYLYQYTHIDGTEKHTRLCPVCGYTDEKNCSIAWVAGEVAEDGTSNHTGACTLCVSPVYTEECNGTDTANPDDCTADHTWKFTCGVHEATYPAGPGNGEHTFTGDWKDVEGTNKQTDKCANCTTVRSRINEDVEITNSEFILTTKGNDVITVKLPEGIKSAKLEIAVEGDYTFEIEGMTPVDGYYAIAEGTTSVTVKVTADVTATGGKLTATLSDVVAIDEYAEIAGVKVAEINIGFQGTMYDADGNGSINLADALAALYVKAGKTDAPDINLANVDTNASGAVDIDEVYAIVQRWLSDVIGTL